MMPDDELTVMWRQAKDQREQVKILAELNGVSTAVMAEKLRGLGCELPELPAAWLRGVPPLKAKDPIFDLDSARALFAEGKSDLEIAEMLGCSEYQFARWRRKNGLRRYTGAAAHKAPRKARMPQPPACKAQPPCRPGRRPRSRSLPRRLPEAAVRPRWLLWIPGSARDGWARRWWTWKSAIPA